MKFLKKHNLFKKVKEIKTISKDEFVKFKHDIIDKIDISDGKEKLIGFKVIIPEWEAKITFNKKLINDFITYDKRIKNAYAMAYPIRDGVVICFTFDLVNDNYAYVERGANDLNKKVIKNNSLFKYIYLTDLDRLTMYFDDIYNLLNDINVLIDTSLDKYKTDKRKELVQSNIDEITDYFIDIIDLSQSHNIFKKQDGGILLIFNIKDIIVDDTSYFKLSNNMLKVMDMLLEVEKRVSDLIPSSELFMNVENDRIHILIR